MNWDELHGNEVMRAKSEIVRTKVQTTYNKEEKTSQRHYGPHLPIKEDIPGSVLGGVTVNTEERRIEVLVTRKKLRLPYSPEMFAV